MARSIWKGTIGFGLLNLPVSLFTAVREQDVSMKQLCPTHEKPITTKRVCTVDGAEVAFEELAKGYDLGAGEYVVLAAEDFERAALPLSRSFDIALCVPEAEIDPRFFHTAYFVAPAPEGARTYALLREALRRSGSAAIGKIALKTKQQVAALRVLGSALVLHLMHWPDELVPADGLAIPDAMPTPDETALAEELVARFKGTLASEEWEDEYRANLQKIIEGRVRGEEVTFQAAPARGATGVVDLVAMLRASLGTAKAA